MAMSWLGPESHQRAHRPHLHPRSFERILGAPSSTVIT